MPIKVTNVNDGLKIKIDSDYNTTSLFSGSKKRYITLNTGSTISIATQDTYGVVRGSDSIIIENGRVKIAPSVLENILEGAATQEWVINQGYATSSWILSQDYASKAYLNQVLEACPTSAELNAILVPYATKEWVEDNFLSGGSAPSDYATKSWVENNATAYNAARLGGYAAIDYPQKAEDAVITGKWTFNDYLNGNLGIGITPTERLHVAGNGLFTGNLSAVNAALSGTLSVAQAATFGGNVGTSNFVSQMLGWRVTPQGQADFRHIYTNELQAKAFTADISQALVGSDILTKSVAKLAQNFKIGANDTYAYLYVEELEGYPGMSVFSIWDKLRLRVFDRSGGGLVIADVWATVTDHNINDTVNNVQKYTVRFDDDGGVVGSDVYAGSMVLDYGTSGSGVIERTVLDQQGSPYSRVSTWTGSPDNPANYTLHYQSGNLNGIANAEGWGVYSENSFLTGKLLVGDLTKQGQFMEYKDGELSIRGKITVTGGNAATKEDVDAIQVGGRNLIRNSSFEGPAFYTLNSVNGGVNTISNEYAYDGTKAWKCVTTGSTNASGGHIQISGLEVGGTYTFSVRVMSLDVAPVELRILTTSWGTVKGQKATLEAGVWQRVAVTFEATDSTLRLAVINGAYEYPTYYIDAIKLEIGNKATDWTPAPEDVQAEINTAKQEALTAASAAQTTANTANTAVGNLNTYVDGAFKDGVIDAAEAKAIEKYKNTLNETMAKAEASYNKVYANTYLEGAAKTSLLNAKVNLWGQRDTLLSAIDTAISGGITTPAQKTAVDNAFNTFNNLMTAFQNALEEANRAIQVKLDNISKGYVDAVQVGGRNLLKNTASGVGWSKTDFDAETRTFTRATTQTSESFVALINQTKLENNTTYTLSAWIRSNGQVKDVDFYIYDKPVSKSHSKQGIAVTTDWQFVTLTFTTDSSTDYSESTIRFDNNGSKTAGVNAILYVKEPKLERGNKATDWSPAPEDVPSALDYLATAIQDGSTDIEGGLINTNVLMVKDTNGEVSGGISGLASDNVGFWTGGSYQAAINNNANVIFRKDGSFSLAGGKIRGTSDGVLSVDGSVVTGMIESSNYDGTVGCRFDLDNGHLLIGDAIRLLGDVSEISVENRDTGLDSFRIGDFTLTPINFAGAGVDVLLGGGSITASPASGSYQLNRTVYVSSSGYLTTSELSYISDSLIIGGLYNFKTKFKITLSPYQHIDTIVGYVLAEKFEYIGGSGIKIQLINGNTAAFEERIVWQQSIFTIPPNGVIPLSISTSFQAESSLLQLRITLDGEYRYRVPYGTDTRFSNTSASVSRFDSSSRLVLQALVNRMEFSTKGMQTVFSSSNYFRCDSTGIEGRGVQTLISPDGRYRLRISNDGIQKSTNYGNTWTAL